MTLNLLSIKEIIAVLKNEESTVEDFNDVFYSLAYRKYIQATSYLDSELDELLYEYDYEFGGPAETKVVDSRFEDGGRWYNDDIAVHQIIGTDVYVEVCREVGSIEMQENGDVSYRLVTPKEKTIIVYE